MLEIVWILYETFNFLFLFLHRGAYLFDYLFVFLDQSFVFSELHLDMLFQWVVYQVVCGNSQLNLLFDGFLLLKLQVYDFLLHQTKFLVNELYLLLQRWPFLQFLDTLLLLSVVNLIILLRRSENLAHNFPNWIDFFFRVFVFLHFLSVVLSYSLI